MSAYNDAYELKIKKDNLLIKILSVKKFNSF